MGKKKHGAAKPGQSHAGKKPPAHFAVPRETWILLSGLLAVTLVAYAPAWHGGMIWDDDGHITRSDLRAASGLWRIWFDIGATQQYYPVTHSAFWLQYQIWGGDTLGYHLVNIILHVLSAFLVAVILKRLSVPWPWLAALIFALHPVHVESVAWMTELKNTLSGCFYLGAALAYLHFDKNRNRRFYAGALILFLLALLSKTVTATLPAALLVVFWWQRGRLSARHDVLPLLPWFALGAVAGFVTHWVERALIGARGEEYVFTFLERCLIAGRATWFYLLKLIWPANLIFIYPRWQISQGIWWQYLYPLGLMILLTALWLWRKRSRAPLAAMLFFCGTLFPVMGFFNVFPFRYSFVADHFQYLASLGVIALFSAGMAGLARYWRWEHSRATLVALLVFGGPLAILTWSQSRQYVNDETLYRTTIRRNPSCWMAYNNLGMALQTMGRDQEASVQYREALRQKPDLAETHCDLGNALQRMGQFEEAVIEYKEALRLKPDLVEALSNLGITLQDMGRLEEAVASYKETLRLKPHFAVGHNNLGFALQKMGRLEESAKEYEEALRLVPDYADARVNLSRVMAEINKGKLPAGR